MTNSPDPTLVDRWFPVARSEEVVSRHVVHAQLLGQEIALWRDDSGEVNAWENRCPHRGVRLSIGFNTGTELRCQYHGWSYASGTGQCTFIPAHPDQKPPNVIRATPYGCVERYGLVWVSLGRDSENAVLPALDLDRWVNLRSVFVEAPAVSVAETLTRDGAVPRDSYILEGPSEDGAVILLLQPLNEEQTLIHALLAKGVEAADRLAILRRHNARLTALRDTIERLAA